ncbi:glycoside hydrolase domain-containing protein [Kitasatospora sp. CB01950]|uniref:glycoside hydrolase domain-containing protein n=1 Tax=Kitasatospora sp. CB01950 TaxID=1703930 RepID=UPI000A4BA854|nr:glycoside hydrolase domain-containing protein [Kitasatospora sp. CB01950]
MSHRRARSTARRPRGRRAALLSAAAVLAIGSGAAALAATTERHHPAPTAAAPAASAPAGTDTAPAESPSPSPSASASGSATPSTSAAPSASGSAPAPASAPVSASAAAPAAKPGTAPATFTGLAFDTCTAPPLATMNAWRGASPYGAAAVYIGGRNRGCAQPQLTPGWVGSVSTAGWKLVPLYVGAQPPCQTGNSPEKLTADTATALGSSDGNDAVAKAAALGMRTGSTLYLDVEAYDTTDTGCAAAVLAYTRSWNRAVHNSGYWAGFYGFASSSAAGIARAAGQNTPDLPDALWYARYDGAADTTGSFPFDAGLWTGHRRAHQYQVNQKESYGGAPLTVDRNAWDAPVAVVG